MKRYVAVAGMIGAGKTSLVSWLVDRYGLLPFYEPNEQNPYLEDFYRDMRRWALPSQLYFLAHRMRLHQALEASERPSVIDRTIWEDAEIFARNAHEQGFLDPRDWALYSELYEGIRRTVRPPDVLIALRCTIRTARQRIRRRGRAMEANIPDDYLRRLHHAYTHWFEAYTLSPIVVIETDKMDYVENLVHLLDLRDRLDVALGG